MIFKWLSIFLLSFCLKFLEPKSLYNFNNEKKLLPLVDDKIRPQKENSNADKLRFYNNVLIVNPFINDLDENVKAKTGKGLVYQTKLFPLTNLEKFNNRTIKKSEWSNVKPVEETRTFANLPSVDTFIHSTDISGVQSNIQNIPSSNSINDELLNQNNEDVSIAKEVYSSNEQMLNENLNQNVINVPETENEPISFNQDDELSKDKDSIVSDREEINEPGIKTTVNSNVEVENENGDISQLLNSKSEEEKNEPGIKTTVYSNVETENENESLSRLLNSNSGEVNELLNNEENNSSLYIQAKVDSGSEEVSATITSTIGYQERDSQDLVIEKKLQATDRENTNPETDLQHNTHFPDDISDKIFDIYTTEMQNLDLKDKTNHPETVVQTEGQADNKFTPSLVDSPFRDFETDKINVRRNNKLKLKIDSKNIKLNSPNNIDFTDYEYVDYISDDGLITKKMIVGPKNAFHVIHPRTGRYESPNIEDFPLDLNKDGFLFQESENSETLQDGNYTKNESSISANQIEVETDDNDTRDQLIAEEINAPTEFNEFINTKRDKLSPGLSRAKTESTETTTDYFLVNEFNFN